ncbi:hypothetical protein [Streptantibioticus silvisoli]|uniref:DUF2637 domain-containing protein n=1 Tax=Streptantibioticus silvisoli TaxID=2705255 RepID=A0ABT6W4S8_9ACTN|nr:hypothetical protein [Streptantibioticus silvisoli]MDI5965756.1 hypothetical protein [Streptantibioticus silvisoli]
MTTAPARLYGPNGQPVNGHTVDTPKRAAATQIRLVDFPINLPTPTVAPTQTLAALPVSVEQHAHAEPVQPTSDPLAEAQAEAIRLDAAAKAEARRVAAAAEAEATAAKAAEEKEALRIANEKEALNLKRNQLRFDREKADNDTRIAAANRKREEEERTAREAREAAEAERRQNADAQTKVASSAKSWRKAAISFAIVCAIVALPVQMSAFYNPNAPWLLAAPVVLEGGAWVVLRGAAAAVDDHRPHWHYRLIAWTLAFLAAGINLSHGLTHFDMATAAGTAFASLAGPGVWDLHEHGRIRLRDGKLTRAQRRAAKKEAARIAAEEKAAKQRADVAKAAEEKAAAEAAQKLAKQREEFYPKEWERAVRLSTALGETTVSEATWRQACFDVNGAAPGEDANVVGARNAAVSRMQKYVTQGAEKGTEKSVSSQRANQMPRAQRGPARKPPTRRAGDTPQYVNAARRQASITAKQVHNSDPQEG